MSQDIFESAARAVRETYDGTSAQGDATRRSLLARATAERGRRRRIVTYVLPLAAVLVLSTAWAAVTGRLPWRLHGANETSTSRPVSPTTVGRGAPPSPHPLPEALAASSAALPAAPEGEMPAPQSAATPPPPPRASGSSHSRPAAAPLPSAHVPDAEESLYSAAHRLHFVDHDPAAALKGWDGYLATYPSGRFALEARYNRSLTLVRLGRQDDARAALAPFADGTYGGYRQREAAALLEALESTP